MGVEYGSDNPNLDARLQGIIPNENTGNDLICKVTQADGNKTFTWNFPFSCKMNGIQINCYQSNIGDYLERVETRYSLDQGATWKRYKKFAKDWTLMNECSERIILFPTEPAAGIMIAIKAVNTGATDLKFSVSLFNFTDQETIDVAQGMEGADW